MLHSRKGPSFLGGSNVALKQSPKLGLSLGGRLQVLFADVYQSGRAPLNWVPLSCLLDRWQLIRMLALPDVQARAHQQALRQQNRRRFSLPSGLYRVQVVVHLK